MELGRFQFNLASAIAGFLSASLLLGIQFVRSEKREITHDSVFNDMETMTCGVEANYGWPLKCVSITFTEKVTWRVHAYILTAEDGTLLHGDYPVNADGVRLKDYNVADAISREKIWPPNSENEATIDMRKLIADGVICALITLFVAIGVEWLSRRLSAYRKLR